jgi:hypothetical protein
MPALNLKNNFILVIQINEQKKYEEISILIEKIRRRFDGNPGDGSTERNG